MPWTALIVSQAAGSRTRERCGGSLINDRYILTSAACVNNTRTIDVYLGGNNEQRISETREIFSGVDDLSNLKRDIGKTVLKMSIESEPILHDKFRTGELVHYNLALLRLPRAVDFSQFGHIRPVCLPSAGDSHSGREAVTAGFGHTAVDRYEGNETRKGHGTDFATFLQKLKVKILNSRSCTNSFRPLIGSFRAAPDKLCALRETGDVCDGDKGAGLVVDKGSGQRELVGVASFTVGCLSTFRGARLPIVYSRVTAVLDWIERKTSDASSCRISSTVTSPTRGSSGRSPCEQCGENFGINTLKVIGGRDASPGEYPWAALALIDNTFRQGVPQKLTLITQIFHFTEVLW